MNWTDAQIVELAKLWGQGLSARQIGELMGYSRNAVCGKVFRLGLYRDETLVRRARMAATQKRPVAPRRTRPSAPPRPQRARPQVHAAAVIRRASAPMGRQYAKVATPVVDAANAKPWLERAFGECAYPISGEGADTHSCCQPAQPQGYCKAHAAVMFNAPSEPVSKLLRLARVA